jgi:hypothetical protein
MALSQFAIAKAVAGKSLKLSDGDGLHLGASVGQQAMATMSPCGSKTIVLRS